MKRKYSANCSCYLSAILIALAILGKEHAADYRYAPSPPVYQVPPGHYFMMGDNRDNSTDSRVLSQVGYVPFENIVGRAQIIFFSIAEGEHAWMIWRWPWTVRWSRLFTIVR